MKKILCILVVMMLCSFAALTTACSPFSSDEQAVIKEDVYDTYDLFRTSWKDAKSIDEIKDTIKDWASENEISCQEIEKDGLMLSLDASDDYTRSPGTIIHCQIGLKETKGKSQCAAIALAAVKNSSLHGPVRVLFTACDGSDSYGAKVLDKKYLSMDNFISLDSWPKVKMFTGSTSTTEYTFTKNIKRVASEGNTAYKIKISGLEGGNSADRSRKHPNPIMTLGELLNTLNQSGLIFQATGLKGGDDPGNFAKDAEVTVVIDDNDIKKLEDKVQSRIDSFEESNISKESDLQFTCEKCKVPQTCWSDDDLTHVISFFYTITDGKLESENEDDAAITNIGLAKDDGKSLTINAKARALAKEQISTITTSYQSTAKLAEFKLDVKNVYPGWPFRENSDLIASFGLATKQVSLDLEPEWTYHENVCAIYYEKKPAMDMISIGANIDSGQEIAQSIILYLQSLGDKK